MGEISQTIVAEKILGEKPEYITFEDNVPVRPPVMCPGCPHRGLFYCLHKLGVMVSGDIGCYTFSAQQHRFVLWIQLSAWVLLSADFTASTRQ